MGERILVTGGAGFIGSHLVDALVAEGHDVLVLDNLDPEAHGEAASFPAYANPGAQYVKGDVRDRKMLSEVLRGRQVVFHYAAAVGSGISMVAVRRYVEINAVGTATLLECLAGPGVAVRKLIVASSMTVMGEGTYHCASHGTVYPPLRGVEQLEREEWEVCCPSCGARTQPVAMVEQRPLQPTSIYGLTKRDQEEMCLLLGRAHRIPTVAFRYFSVYGPRQSLVNPYTGVIARFATRLMCGKPPLVFEDGQQRKDCVHVRDVVRANLLALHADGGDYENFNIGSGQPKTVLEMARAIARGLGVALEPVVVGKFRASDARHGWAGTEKAKRLLGWEPLVSFDEGILDLCTWLRGLPPAQIEAAIATFERVEQEAQAKGLQF